MIACINNRELKVTRLSINPMQSERWKVSKMRDRKWGFENSKTPAPAKGKWRFKFAYDASMQISILLWHRAVKGSWPPAVPSNCLLVSFLGDWLTVIVKPLFRTIASTLLRSAARYGSSKSLEFVWILLIKDEVIVETWWRIALTLSLLISCHPVDSGQTAQDGSVYQSLICRRGFNLWSPSNPSWW